MLSLPATSQSVTIVNNDTLICLPDSIARKVIADLEEGDLCQRELLSYKKDVESYLTLIGIKEEEITNFKTIVTKKDGIITELNVQLGIKEKEIAVLKTGKAANYWKGLFTGLGAGAGLVLVLTLL
jgi:predicted DNA-binding transcriptional regulator